jgi:hypothetical protein
MPDDLEHRLTLRQADQARTDFAAYRERFRSHHGAARQARRGKSWRFGRSTSWWGALGSLSFGPSCSGAFAYSNTQASTILPGHLGGVGLDLVAARLTPHN